jgi:hypothetical protein
LSTVDDVSDTDVREASSPRSAPPKPPEPPARSRFARTLTRFTQAIHLPAALAFGEIAKRLGAPAPYAYAIGLGTAALAYLPYPTVLASLMWDKPRSKARRLLVEEPYYAHWCACFASAVPITLASIAWPLTCLAQGRPAELPGAFALGTYGFFLGLSIYGVMVRRKVVVVRRVEVPIVDLPEAFDGYRIAQLSDLHVGGFSPLATALEWAALANAEKPDLTVVTGDLVTSGTAFHDDITEAVAALSAKDGTVVSMGNHDYFGEGDPLVQKLRGRGVSVLRNESRLIQREGAEMRVGALDDTWTKRDDLPKVLRDGVPTVLLAHDPDLFFPAAEAGVPLTLSGHTHGGQVALPFFAERWNPARLKHKHTLGLYRVGDAYHYVHGGLGVTGPPVRLGVPPEIAILTLRRA